MSNLKFGLVARELKWKVKKSISSVLLKKNEFPRGRETFLYTFITLFNIEFTK